MIPDGVDFLARAWGYQLHNGFGITNHPEDKKELCNKQAVLTQLADLPLFCYT